MAFSTPDVWESDMQTSFSLAQLADPKIADADAIIAEDRYALRLNADLGE